MKVIEDDSLIIVIGD